MPPLFQSTPNIVAQDYKRSEKVGSTHQLSLGLYRAFESCISDIPFLMGKLVHMLVLFVFSVFVCVVHSSVFYNRFDIWILCIVRCVLALELFKQSFHVRELVDEEG